LDVLLGLTKIWCF